MTTNILHRTRSATVYIAGARAVQNLERQADVCPSRVEIAQVKPNLGRLPELGQIWPSSTDVGPSLTPSSAKFGLGSTKVGPSSAPAPTPRVGARNRPSLARVFGPKVGPDSVDSFPDVRPHLTPTSAGDGQSWPRVSTNIGPDVVQFWAIPGRRNDTCVLERLLSNVVRNLTSDGSHPKPKLCPTCSQASRGAPLFGHSWRDWPSVGQTWRTRAKVGPSLVRHRPLLVEVGRKS